MKSIRARLTVWYALTATVTIAVLFIVGYALLEDRLIRGLDVLNAAQFEQVKGVLGPDYQTVGTQIIEEYMRETMSLAAVHFYLDIHAADGRPVFTSANLAGNQIPLVAGARNFNARANEIGELRVGTFVLRPYEVVIASSLTPVQEAMNDYVKVSAALVAFMLIAGVAIGLGFSEMMLRPVRLIGDTARRISSSNLSERIAVAKVKDELSNMARVLNDMFDRLEASFEQIRRFTDEASHELKTPLSLVRLHAEKLLGDGSLAAPQKEAVLVQLEELGRLNQIIDELLLLSRADAHAMTLRLERENPSAFVQGFAQDAQVLAEHHGRSFACTHTGDGAVSFEKKWMRQVLLNLLTNALHATPRNGLITLASEVVDGSWRISVENDGPSLTQEQRERIFERFRRLNLPGVEYKGSGLGLAICRSIVALHGGRISALPAQGREGLRVEVEIPAGTSPSA